MSAGIKVLTSKKPRDGEREERWSETKTKIKANIRDNGNKTEEKPILISLNLITIAVIDISDKSAKKKRIKEKSVSAKRTWNAH